MNKMAFSRDRFPAPPSRVPRTTGARGEREQGNMMKPCVLIFLSPLVPSASFPLPSIHPSPTVLQTNKVLLSFSFLFSQPSRPLLPLSFPWAHSHRGVQPRVAPALASLLQTSGKKKRKSSVGGLSVFSRIVFSLCLFFFIRTILLAVWRA